MGPAELQLRRRGIILCDDPNEVDAHFLDDPARRGFIVLQPIFDGRGRLGMQVIVFVRPDIPAGERDEFAAWADQRFDRFLEHGPDPDGWLRRSDGGYQLTCCAMAMPSLDHITTDQP